jgi:hypothetical protein
MVQYSRIRHAALLHLRECRAKHGRWAGADFARFIAGQEYEPHRDGAPAVSGGIFQFAQSSELLGTWALREYAAIRHGYRTEDSGSASPIWAEGGILGWETNTTKTRRREGTLRILSLLGIHRSRVASRIASNSRRISKSFGRPPARLALMSPSSESTAHSMPKSGIITDSART